MSSLKQKATKGVIWSAIDKFGVQFVQFIIGIILARLLTPNEFGLIGMLAIFIAITQSFINSGMSSGLVQKTNRTQEDFSTVFIFNIFISLFFYIILYYSAPYIAEFYEMPQLVPLTRILSVSIIISSFSIVHKSYLTIKLDFKTLAKVNLVSIIISGVISIYSAYQGLGVWALVIQTISVSVISVIMLWYLTNWNPSFLFSKESFKELFGFGSKLLLASLYAQIFNNIYNLAIGKAYSATDLGFYTRSKQFAEFSSGTITGIMQQVTYPILASLQDNRDRMVTVYSRLIRMTAFVIFPSMILLSLLSDSLIKILLGEKWVHAIVLLQWMSLARIFFPINVINMNILNAIGRSDLFLKVDLSKLPLILIVLIFTIPLGVEAVVIGHVITSFIAFFINAYMPGKIFGYGAIKQLKDMRQIMIATLVMLIVVYMTINNIDIQYIKILAGVLIGLFVYGLMCYLFKIEEINEVKYLLNSIIKKMAKRILC